MRRLVLLLLLVGCGYDSEPIEVERDVLIAVEPHIPPAPSGPTASCTLKEDKTTCDCAISECSTAGITAAVKACNRLRDLAKIVIE